MKYRPENVHATTKSRYSYAHANRRVCGALSWFIILYGLLSIIPNDGSGSSDACILGTLIDVLSSQTVSRSQIGLSIALPAVSLILAVASGVRGKSRQGAYLMLLSFAILLFEALFFIGSSYSTYRYYALDCVILATPFLLILSGGVVRFGSAAARWPSAVVAAKQELCLRCGYNLAGLSGWVCPECGGDLGNSRKSF